MLQLSGGLTRQGMRVDLVVASATGARVGAIPPGVRLVDLRVGRVLSALPALVRYLRSERPVCLLSTIRHANVIAAWAVCCSRVPIRLLLRESNTFPRRSDGGWRSFKRRLVQLTMKTAYRRADLIIAPSSGTGSDLMAAGIVPPAKTKVIYNPIDLENIRRAVDQPVAHAWLQEHAGPIVIAMGRLTRQKDFATLIKALARVRKRVPVRLIIFGEGRERGPLLNLATRIGVADAVDLPGFVTNPYAVMAKADVLVSSSAWEGCPNVILEALAVGVSVVATDCPGGSRELLGDGRWGDLVPVGDDIAMAAAIVSSLHHPRSRSILRERAETFDVDVVAAAYAREMMVGVQA